MVAGVEIGTAYVSLVASAKGIKQSITSEISGDMASVGRQAGQSLSKGISGGAQAGMSSAAHEMSTIAAAAADKVESASRKLSTARDAEATALGRVRVAELKLEEVRSSGRATASQVARAEEGLDTARRKATTSTAAVATSEKAVANAKDQARAATDSLSESSRSSGAALDASAAGSGRLAAGLGALKTGALVAAAAVVTAVKEIADQMMEAENAGARLAARMGGDPADSARLGKIAGQAYVGAYGSSMDEMSSIVLSVYQNIGSMSDAETRRMSENVASFTAAFQEDFGKTTSAVGSLLRNGLAPDASFALDVITRGMQLGADKGGDLLDTMIEYAPLFESLGLDSQTAMGMMVQAINSGTRSSDLAADSMKEFALRSKDGSDTSKAAFQSMGLDADKMTASFAAGGPKAQEGLDLILTKLREMKDPVKQNQIGVALFGTQWEDMQDTLLAFDPSTAADGLGEIGGAADQVNKTMGDTATAKMTSWRRTIEQNVVDFATTRVVPALKDLYHAFMMSGVMEDARAVFAEWMKMGAEVRDDLRRWVAEHKTQIDGLVASLQGASAALRPVIITIIQAMQWLWDVFGANALEVVMTNLTAISNFVTGVFQGWMGMIGFFRGFFTTDTQLMWDSIKAMFFGAMTALGAIVDVLLGSIVTMFGGDWGQIKNIVSEAWSWIVQTVSSGVNQIRSAVYRLGELVGQVWGWFQGIASAIRDGVQSAAAYVWSLPGQVASALGGMAARGWEAGSNLVSGLIQGIRAQVGAVVAEAGRMASAAAQAVKDKMGIRSPSTVFAKMGEQMGDGLVLGLARSVPLVAAAAATMMSASSGTLGVASAGGIDAVGPRGGGMGGVNIYVTGAPGQSVDSLATAIASKYRVLGRL